MRQLGKVITAGSTPIYDSFGFWDDHWECYDWIQWHKALKAKYGLQMANDRFAEAWNNQSIWDAPYNWCKYNGQFAEYLKAQGLDPGHVISKVITGSGELVDDVSDAAQSISGMLPTLLVLGALGYGLFYFTQKKTN